MQAGMLGDMEGAASLADSLDCGPAFKVLQTLVQNWLMAAVRYSSACVLSLLITPNLPPPLLP